MQEGSLSVIPEGQETLMSSFTFTMDTSKLQHYIKISKYNIINDGWPSKISWDRYNVLIISTETLSITSSSTPYTVRGHIEAEVAVSKIHKNIHHRKLAALHISKKTIIRYVDLLNIWNPRLKNRMYNMEK